VEAAELRPASFVQPLLTIYSAKIKHAEVHFASLG